ncbi:TM2 domain-containing protein [Pseudovibrio hongkongensis]|uniref:NINE protein n=1 Tax=Polycladidibacter hongkongensis TaxID=1647556 RepID=UPI00082D23B4
MTETASQQISAGWGFCTCCGQKIAHKAVHCPKCGAPQANTQLQNDTNKSPKSYGVAVALCGLFGMMGIHHFYIGNILHGLFDLCLFTAWVFLIYVSEPTSWHQAALGLTLLLLDFVHTAVVFYRLICGKEVDSEGRRIAIPGQ